MNPHFTILADDLSGAADCAAPFARAGFSTEVFLQPEVATRTDQAVISIDLNTRELTSDEAVRVNSRALRLIESKQETIWYRKVDSTLRGNVGSDVLSTLKGIPGKKVILFAPAFPDTGRTTIRGHVFVHERSLDESGVNTEWPMGKSVADLFAEIGLPTQILSLEVIRSGCSNILRHLQDRPSVTVAVCDTETNSDLLAIAEAGLQLRTKSLFVGSAGLAQQIAMRWGAKQRIRHALPNKPVLAVVGSKSSVARAQFELLSNLSGLQMLRVPVTALKTESGPWIRDAVSRALALGEDLAITIEPGDNFQDQRGAGLVEVLGRTLRPCLDKFSALVLTGGETARSILFQSEIGRLRVVDEIEPGVTLSTTVGRPPLAVVMKAGAFGAPATLLNAVHFLRRCRK